VEVTSICQTVLEDFNLCLFYLPSNLNQSTSSEEEEDLDRGYSFLPDLLIFHMMVICLMSVHSLKKTGTAGSRGGRTRTRANAFANVPLFQGEGNLPSLPWSGLAYM